MIEVQSGDYLGEDDIVRFEDIYNRAVVASDLKYERKWPDPSVEWSYSATESVVIRSPSGFEAQRLRARRTVAAGPYAASNPACAERSPPLHWAALQGVFPDGS